MKSKHSSLDLPDIPAEASETSPEAAKTNNKAKMPGDIWWNKFTNLGDVLKSKNNGNEVSCKKSKTQTTLDYFLKPRPKSESTKSDKRQMGPNGKIRENGRPSALQKQMSVGSYPILLNIPEESTISRDRPATVCGDKPGVEHKNTMPLTLERPRKKLSFREPEITGYSRHVIATDTLPRKNIKPFTTPQLPRSNFYNGGGITKWTSYEDLDLEVHDLKITTLTSNFLLLINLLTSISKRFVFYC